MPTTNEAQRERLAKFLARAGVVSRRHAEELIVAGRVQVNGTVIVTPGAKVDPAHDIVMVHGRQIQPSAARVTVAVNKPVGVIATASDPQRRAIVADLLPEHLRMLHLVPVGRLDADSEGLLLLSNDGQLVLHLTHPRYEAEKAYHALVAGQVTDDALQRLRQGVVLTGENPAPTAQAQVERLVDEAAPPGMQWIEVVLREGRKRQVRLMFAAVGARVERLVRVRIGQLYLDDIVPEAGDWHVLSPDEIVQTLRQ